MDETDYQGRGGAPLSLALSVVLPVAVLLIVIAVVAGLVFGGVIQGHEERQGPEAPSTTQSTIVIEP